MARPADMLIGERLAIVDAVLPRMSRRSSETSFCNQLFHDAAWRQCRGKSSRDNAGTLKNLFVKESRRASWLAVLPEAHATTLPKLWWDRETIKTPWRWDCRDGFIGWGLAHRVWTRKAHLIHLDWFPVAWNQASTWQYWTEAMEMLWFIDPRLLAVLSLWDRLHGVGSPGAQVVLREAWDIEMALGCGVF